VTIDFDAGGQALNFSSQTIDEDLPGKEKPTHISVDLQKPSADVSLKSVIRVDHGR
jgi:hypothetical protein